MPEAATMIAQDNYKLVSAVFLTFSGNCKKALTFYQTCFGGTLQFETFGRELQGYAEMPVISGSLVSDRIVIYGSDLVHDEGRKLGNYMAIFLPCKNRQERKALLEKLAFDQKKLFVPNKDDPKLIEVTDAFDVRLICHVLNLVDTFISKGPQSTANWPLLYWIIVESLNCWTVESVPAFFSVSGLVSLLPTSCLFFILLVILINALIICLSHCTGFYCYRYKRRQEYPRTPMASA